MNNSLNIPVEILLGGDLESIDCNPLPPYSIEVVNFLSDLSKRLLKNPQSRIYPDITGFAYWVRKASLNRLSKSFESKINRIGRGLAFHITPANVPVNFAFSFAFGLLSGNANIVRIPGINHPQTDVICKEMARLFGEPEHKRVATMNRVIKYPRQDEITKKLSAISNARILWGGDETIAHLRSMQTLPRCIDICFADRYSICIMLAEAILEAEQNTMDNLISSFYNDVFLLDQNACSSPHLIIWQGGSKEVFNAQNRFWQAMEYNLKTKPVPPGIHAIDKYNHYCRTAISLDSSKLNLEQTNYFYRVKVEKLPQDIENHRGQYGFFFEIIDNNLKCFESIVNERYQTVTYFGKDPQEIIDKVIAKGLKGIDRVVPVGKALDIGVIWDGYDIIGTLSRIISKQ